MSQSIAAKPTPAECEAICKRAAKAYEGCLPDVRRWLDAGPWMARANGNPARFLCVALLKSFV